MLFNKNETWQINIFYKCLHKVNPWCLFERYSYDLLINYRALLTNEGRLFRSEYLNEALKHIVDRESIPSTSGAFPRALLKYTNTATMAATTVRPPIPPPITPYRKLLSETGEIFSCNIYLHTFRKDATYLPLIFLISSYLRNMKVSTT